MEGVLTMAEQHGDNVTEGEEERDTDSTEDAKQQEEEAAGTVDVDGHKEVTIGPEVAPSSDVMDDAEFARLRACITSTKEEMEILPQDEDDEMERFSGVVVYVTGKRRAERDDAHEGELHCFLFPKCPSLQTETASLPNCPNRLKPFDKLMWRYKVHTSRLDGF